jgi:hypothetical protein
VFSRDADFPLEVKTWALVSDQEVFGSVDIGTGPDFTVVATLKLPPGGWVVFATVALASATSATGTTTVQMAFQLDGELCGTAVQSDFTITDESGGAVGGFQVVLLTTGLALDRPKTLQVGCVATRKLTVSSQPTTITAIQVESVTRF